MQNLNNSNSQFDTILQVRLLEKSLDDLITVNEQLSEQLQKQNEKLDKQNEKYNELKGRLDLFKQELQYLREQIEKEKKEQKKQLEQVNQQANKKIAVIALVLTSIQIGLQIVEGLLKK